MKLGIIGLPNVGKSSLFNVVTKSNAVVANYPYSTVESNVGVVAVPDDRIDFLHEMYDSKKTVYATIEFCDIAGLAKGASTGEGLGNKFLGHIREAQAMIHVVRCFEDDNVIHVSGKVDPVADVETVNFELIFADLEVLERRVEKTKKSLKGNKDLQKEFDLLSRIVSHLEDGAPVRSMELGKEEKEFVQSLDLLTTKPVIYVANVSEDEAASADDNPNAVRIREIALAEGADVVTISAKLEAELLELDDEEREEYIEELGITGSGLDKLIKASYHLLDLLSYLTAGEPEVRAWTIRRGTKAPQAAGKIHGDIERGFIRAETISFDDLKACGDMHSAREKGLVRSEGKDYTVQDGDVIHFLFNV